MGDGQTYRTGRVQITLERGNDEILRAILNAIPSGTTYWVDLGAKMRGLVVRGDKPLTDYGEIDCRPADGSHAPSYIVFDEIESIEFDIPPGLRRSELLKEAEEKELQAQAATEAAQRAREAAERFNAASPA